MPISTCPMMVVKTPAGAVWEIIFDPETYGAWTDAKPQSIIPPGKAAPGQTVHAKASALGISRDVTVNVEAVDVDKRTLDLTTHLPFGITVHNHITIQPIDAGTCQVSFG